ncbi:MAG TPA: hypothetical protein VM577_19410 [Anaerovoracaceae bacterium]|nr:hypothetical protein [Anaerovoracaceae bacterium]
MKKLLAEEIFDAVVDEDYTRLDRLFDLVQEQSREELFRLLGHAEEELTGRMKTREMAEYFTKKGVNLIWTDVNEETTLHKLNKYASPELVTYFFELGGDINAARYEDSNTPLDCVLFDCHCDFDEMRIRIRGDGEEPVFSDAFVMNMVDLGATYTKEMEHKNKNQRERVDVYQERKHFEAMVQAPVEQEVKTVKRKNKI